MWSVSLRDVKYIKNTILLGAGWREYEKSVNLYTKYFWKTVLDKRYLHSVRDNYTKARLRKMGIGNVINTGCPTMWNLTPEFCSTVPEKKAKNVITTLTNYRATKPEIDEKMLNILFKHYEHVFVWIQAFRQTLLIHGQGIHIQTLDFLPYLIQHLSVNSVFYITERNIRHGPSARMQCLNGKQRISNSPAD